MSEPAPVLDRAGSPEPSVRASPAPSAAASHARLEARSISKVFEGAGGPVTALTGVSLAAASGEFVSIVGPSGGGKSTLLDILAGLQLPTSGTVWIDGKEASNRPGGIGYMPQKDLLLPWRTVLDNTILGLELAGTPRRRARAEAARWFPRFGLEGFERRYPDALSGGMRQRTALLRTFLAGREILLLDEPFGALDAMTRAQMQIWLLGIQAELRKTIVLVTHDVDEALYLSDRVYLMTARPGSIAAVLPVGLDRTRGYEQAVTSPEFISLKRVLLDLLAGMALS